MRAPYAIVNLDSGESVNLDSLYADRPLALVFMRHYGCIFCREQLASLREFKDDNIVLVGMGDQKDTVEFKKRMEVPQTIISDPTKGLFQQFGLRRASFGQFVNRRVVNRGINALRAGHREGLPNADPMQLAGVFILNQDGEVVFEHRSSDSSDNLLGPQIAAELRARS
ncbi:MAG: peroxiredoxin-like family protein [Armatimonadota bacterium]